MRMMLKEIASFFLAAIIVALLVSLFAFRDISERKKTLQAESRFADTRHGRVAYASWGEGPAILVVHGAGGGFDQGRLLAQTFGEDGFRWIAVSRFGYLGSDLPEDSSTAAQAEAFSDLLESLSVSRVSILAMSGGVPPSLKFAEMYPEKTDRMALLSPAPFTPFDPDVEDRPVPTWIYAALLGNDVVYWALTKVARGWLANAFDARPELRRDLASPDEAFVQNLIDGFLPASERMAGLRNEAAAVDPDARYGLETISVPVLVAHAKDDRINPYEVGEKIARRIDRAELLSIKTGGHLLLGHHQELKSRIRAFLEPQ